MDRVDHVDFDVKPTEADEYAKMMQKQQNNRQTTRRSYKVTIYATSDQPLVSRRLRQALEVLERDFGLRGCTVAAVSQYACTPHNAEIAGDEARGGGLYSWGVGAMYRKCRLAFFLD